MLLWHLRLLVLLALIATLAIPRLLQPYKPANMAACQAKGAWQDKVLDGVCAEFRQK